MAIAKTIPIHHTSQIDNTYVYVQNEEKTRLSNSNKILSQEELEQIELQKEEYLKNSELACLAHTNNDEVDLLITGYCCSPATAIQEFKLTEQKYRRIHGDYQPVTAKNKYGREVVKREIIAYHIIQSFPKYQKIEPHEVNQMGVELAEALGQYQAIVCTHLDKDHLHNHILACNYAMDGTHKIPLTMDFREHIRDINDQISMNHGFEIPIQLQERDRFAKTKNWLDFQESKGNLDTGKLWKTNLRNDIAFISKVAISFDDYIQKMKNAGYVVRNNEKSITYILPDKSHSCKDSFLGKECTKQYLLDYFAKKELSIANKKDNQMPKNNLHSPKKKDVIDICKYDDYGKKRSALEMSILFAIEVIKRTITKHSYSNHQINSPVYMTATEKLNALEKALNLITQNSISQKEQFLKHLEKNKQACDSVLSNEKKITKQLNQYDEISSLLTESASLINSFHFSEKDLHLNYYSQDYIHKKQAELVPATGKQKRQLFLELNKNTNRKIIYPLNELSAKEANSALEYFSDSFSNPKPEFIISATEYNEMREKDNLSLTKKTLEAYETYRTEVVKKRHMDKKVADPEFVNEVMQKAALKGLSFDLLLSNPVKESLSEADWNEIDQYLDFQDTVHSPFIALSSPLISEQITQILIQELEHNGLMLSRKENTLTQKEYEDIVAWMEKGFPENQKPLMIAEINNRNEISPISSAAAKQIKELALIRNINLSISPEMYSVNEGLQIRDYLLHMRDIPKCLAHIPEIAQKEIPITKEPVAIALTTDLDIIDKNNEQSFISELQNNDYSVEQISDAVKLRKNMNTLLSVGICPDEVYQFASNMKKLEHDFSQISDISALISKQQTECQLIMKQIGLDKESLLISYDKIKSHRSTALSTQKDMKDTLELINLIDNPKFIYGPEYEKEIVYIMNETEKKTEERTEEKDIYANKEKNREDVER